MSKIHDIEDNTFAAACYNDNTIAELREALAGDTSTRENDCAQWGITHAQWAAQIKLALDAKLEIPEAYRLADMNNGAFGEEYTTLEAAKLALREAVQYGAKLHREAHEELTYEECLEVSKKFHCIVKLDEQGDWVEFE
jgi:hypothetical protein